MYTAHVQVFDITGCDVCPGGCNGGGGGGGEGGGGVAVGEAGIAIISMSVVKDIATNINNIKYWMVKPLLTSLYYCM